MIINYKYKHSKEIKLTRLVIEKMTNIAAFVFPVTDENPGQIHSILYLVVKCNSLTLAIYVIYKCFVKTCKAISQSPIHY